MFVAKGFQTEKITVNANQVENRISPLIYGSNIEDVNHEIYGGFYNQRIFGESFEEPATGVDHSRWKRYGGFWTAKDGAVTIIPGRNTTSDVFMNGTHSIGVEPDQSAKLVYDREAFADATVQADVRFTGKGESGALLVRVAKPGIGHDVFDGYEISLSRDGKKLRLGKHRQDFKLLTEAAVQVDPEAWNTLNVKLTGPEISVFLNQRPVLRYTDKDAPLLTGKVGLRTWKSGLELQKDPSLQLIHSAWWRPDSPNMAYVFRQLNGKADYWDLHVGGDDPKAGAETDRQLTNMLQLFKQWDPNTTMKIAVFEENGSKHGIQRALGHATNMNTIRRHSAHVLTSSPANSLEPYLQNDNDWNQGQIFFYP